MSIIIIKFIIDTVEDIFLHNIDYSYYKNFYEYNKSYYYMINNNNQCFNITWDWNSIKTECKKCNFG